MIALTEFERRLRWQLLTLAPCFPLSPDLPAGITCWELGVLADPSGERASGPEPNTRPPFHGFGEALRRISMYEVEHGRPMLSALVDRAEGGEVIDDLPLLAEHLGLQVDDPDTFRHAELVRVVDFWLSVASDPTRVKDNSDGTFDGEI